MTWPLIMDEQKSKSKKLSDTKPEKQPDSITFFVDRCLGRELWRALRAAGFDAQHKDDHFAQNTDDSDWLPLVGSWGWVVLTRDTRIRLHPFEKEAVIAASVRLFSLQTKRGEGGRRGLNGKEMRDLFLANMPKIIELATGSPGPFIAGVTRTGVRLMFQSAKDS